MKKNITIVILSLLVLSMGYLFAKSYVYDVGYIAGQQLCANQVNAMISNGQLILPELSNSADSTLEGEEL